MKMKKSKTKNKNNKIDKGDFKLLKKKKKNGTSKNAKKP